MLGGALASAGVLGWRLFDWHVQQSAELSARGASSLLIRSEITPRRGSILDRDDDVLAISRGAVRVVADPLAIHELSDPFEVADRLSNILNLDPTGVAERLGNPDLRYSEIARGLLDEPATGDCGGDSRRAVAGHPLGS